MTGFNWRRLLLPCSLALAMLTGCTGRETMLSDPSSTRAVTTEGQAPPPETSTASSGGATPSDTTNAPSALGGVFIGAGH